MSPSLLGNRVHVTTCTKTLLDICFCLSYMHMYIVHVFTCTCIFMYMLYMYPLHLCPPPNAHTLTSFSSTCSDSQDVPRPTNPDPYATTAFFPSPQQRVTGLHDMSHMTTDSSSQYFTSMLYSQLAMASNMCSELLHTQNNLVGAVCSHLEMIGYQAGIQQHQSALFHYQKELEQYYHELYQRYSQVSVKE